MKIKKISSKKLSTLKKLTENNAKIVFGGGDISSLNSNVLKTAVPQQDYITNAAEGYLTTNSTSSKG